MVSWDLWTLISDVYSSFNIKTRQRQIVWTLLLARILGDIKSICAQ